MPWALPRTIRKRKWQLSEVISLSTEGVAAVLFGAPEPAFALLCNSTTGNCRLAHQFMISARRELPAMQAEMQEVVLAASLAMTAKVHDWCKP